MTHKPSDRIALEVPSPKRALERSMRGDRGIWIIIVLLSLISLAAVYSSTSSLAFLQGRTASFYLFRQFAFVTLGLATLFVCHLIPLGWYRKFSFLGMMIAIALLIITLVAGETHNDATRWITILGITIQPSEVVKVAMILYVAKVIEDRKFETFKEFTLYLMAPLGILTLLMLWGSISAGLILGGTAFLILLISGISFKHISKMMGIFFIGLILVVALAKATPLFPRIETAVSRITTFADDGKGDTFQADHAKIAIASGGIFGKGPGNSTQRIILPKPYHDFIYAIIVEEYGIVGGGAVLLLFLWFFFRCYLIAKRCTRNFSSLLVIGLGLLIVLQAMLHICVNVGLLPVTGQTLPLVSLGGTSFIAVSAAFGIILAVSRTIERTEMKKEVFDET